MQTNMVELTRLVADRTLDRDMENEDWQKAIAINGLLSMNEEPYISEARKLVNRSIQTQTSEGQLSYGALDGYDWPGHEEVYRSQVDPVAIGYSVLDFYRRTGEERYIEAARAEYEFLQQHARRTADGGIAHHRGTVELWVDAIYMICPFLVRYGELTETPSAFDEAGKQVELQTKYLQDPHTDLFRHEWRETPNTYPEDTFWSRGNGWAAAGIIDSLGYLKADEELYNAFVNVFESLAEAVVDYQDSSGFWHNVLDDPESPLETSGTLMFAYAFKRAYDLGILVDEKYLDAAERALEVVAGVVDDDGDVRRVVGPPGGPDAPFAVTSYGQGWFMMAANVFLDG